MLYFLSARNILKNIAKSWIMKCLEWIVKQMIAQFKLTLTVEESFHRNITVALRKK